MNFKSFEHYENILEELRKYSKIDKSKLNFEKDIEIIEKMLNSQKFTIAIVANMSAGKSTFINALFGDDILPALEKATTDCATYIKSNNDNDDNQAIIHFMDPKRKNIIIPKNEVKKEIKYYAVKDSVEITDRYKGVDNIELKWDFLNIKTDSHNKIEIIFIDTPGPNNTEKEFSEKHKNQTAKLINEVDMILYLFDYTQVDACLSGDEQGIWNKIQSRYENDKTFKVFFIINKIDLSLKNLFEQTKTLDTESRKIQRQKEWTKESQLAVEKIKNAAINHGFENPEIYTVASELALWDRQNKNGFLDEDYEDRFETSKNEIRRVWEDSWENKFYELIGFNKIENDINNFIQSSIQEKVLNKIHQSISSIIEEKKSILFTQTQFGQKTEEKSKKNLQNAENILKEEVPKIRKRFESIIDERKVNLYSDLKSNLDDAYQKTFSDEQLSIIVKKTIYFIALIAHGSSFNIARNLSKEPKNYNSYSIEKTNAIEQRSKHTKNELFDMMDSFCKTLISDQFRDFRSDSKNKVNNTYKIFKDAMNEEYKKSKIELQEKLSEILEIKLPNISSEIYSIDIKSENLNITFENSLITTEEIYGFLNVGKVFKFFNSELFNKKVVNFDVKNFYLKLKNNIESQFDLLMNNELNNHKNKLDQFVEQYTDLFKDFEDKKSMEIDELRENFSLNKKKYENLRSNLNSLNLIIGKLNGK